MPPLRQQRYKFTGPVKCQPRIKAVTDPVYQRYAISCGDMTFVLSRHLNNLPPSDMLPSPDIGYGSAGNPSCAARVA